MGGTIELDSVYGVGTTMTVRVSFEKASLELIDSHRAISLPNPSLPIYPHLRRSDYHVLVAEDNSLLSEITEKMLTKSTFLSLRVPISPRRICWASLLVVFVC
jgi:hypothetical protein